MSVANVIIKSTTWMALKALMYKRGEELKPGHSDFSDLKVGEFSLSGLDVVDCVRFVDPGNNSRSFTVNDCAITVQQVKNIVKTAMQGVNGTVKEYISDGDYAVTLKGRISSNVMDCFPYEEVEELVYFCQLPEALPIESEYLRSVFGIHNLVVEEYNLQRREGWMSVQEFEIKCVSHLPVELILIDE